MIGIMIIYLLSTYAEVQTDWVGGSGITGPVLDWGDKFWQSDSVTHNIQGQISPVATDVDPNAWVKHIIDQDTDIRNINSLVPGDFDNDGDPDLVGVKGGADIIVFYENLGDTFVQVSSFAAPGDYNAFISVNYMNNDSLIDVVVSGYSGGLSWFENSGGFTFTQHIIISSSATYGFVETGDIDNDGNIDIATGGASIDGPIDIWKNDGSGGFTVVQTISDDSWRLRFDDLDGDGNLDLINAEYQVAGGGTHIYFNDGTGNFAQAAFLNSNDVDAMWSRDFDNDGDIDILTGEFPSGSNPIHWWENDGSGTNYTPHTVYSGGSWLYGDGAFAEDMDMDGKLDVLSGYARLGFFRQITLDDFTEYVIDASLPSNTHWLYPFHRGMCFLGVDVLVSCNGYFLWYENQMVNQFTDLAWLESSILELDSQQRELRWFGWEACVPYDSTLTLYWRADSTAGGIATKPWIGPHYSIVGGSSVIRDSIDLPQTPCYRYFQYKVECWSSGNDAPIVYEVWVTDTTCGTMGVEEQDIVAKEPFTLKVLGDEILLLVNEPVRDAGLYIYNITGEFVQVVHKGKLEAHSYKFTPKLPASGVYFVVLKSSFGTKTAKLLNLK